MADDLVVAADEVKRRGPRGNYQVSARVARALTLLASGECRTQELACAAAGLTSRALRLALQRPSTKAYMQDVVMKSLGLTALKAAKKIDELLDSDNAMVAFNSSRYALAAGLNVAPPDRSSGPTINIAIGEVRAGYVLDLRSDEEVAASLPGPSAHQMIDVTPNP